MRFRRNVKIELGLKEIDIAPLVNILFLLLIFFMLTSTFVVRSGIAVNLPRLLTSEALMYETVEISLIKDGRLFLDKAPSSLDGIERFLSAVSKRNIAVLIKADKEASLGALAQVWDICRKSGVRQINVATEQ